MSLTKCYKYGVPFMPESAENLVQYAFRRNHRFKNEIIEILNRYRIAEWTLVLKHYPELKVAYTKYQGVMVISETLYQEMNAQKQKSSSGVVSEETLDLLKEARSHAWKQLDVVRDLYRALLPRFKKPACKECKKLGKRKKCEECTDKYPSTNKKTLEDCKIAFHLKYDPSVGDSECWNKELTASDVAYIKALNELDFSKRGEINNHRKNSGLYNGSYKFVEDAVEAAEQTSPFFEKKGKNKRPPFIPNLIRFRRFEKEGVVGINLSQADRTASKNGEPLKVRDINTREEFAIDLPDPAIFDDGYPRGARRLGSRGQISMRIEKDAEAPHVSFPVIFHRELPRDASIVNMRLVCKARRYHVVFTVKGAPKTKVTGRREEEVTVMIHAPKEVDGVVTLARWVDTKGSSEILQFRDFRLSPKGGEVSPAIKDISKDMQTHRSNILHQAQVVLKDWLKSEPVLPEWFEGFLSNKIPGKPDKTKSTVLTTRSGDFFLRFVTHWKSNRFKGDRKIFGSSNKYMFSGNHAARQRRHDAMECMVQFYHRERHLAPYGDNDRRNKQLRRREVYRRFAADLSQRYKKVTIVKCKAGGADALIGSVASYELLSALTNAFSSRGEVGAEKPLPREDFNKAVKVFFPEEASCPEELKEVFAEVPKKPKKEKRKSAARATVKSVKPPAKSSNSKGGKVTKRKRSKTDIQPAEMI